jgi:hypothetical protein
MPSSRATYRVPLNPPRKSSRALAWFSMVTYMTSFPLAFSTAMLTVAKRKSTPIYLRLLMGCSFVR